MKNQHKKGRYRQRGQKQREVQQIMTAEDLEQRDAQEAEAGKYCFFWKTGSPFSQWHKSRYTLDGYEYSCSEQGMMHSKALLFGDEEVAVRIMALSSNDQRKMKLLGRQVRGFSERIWKQHRQDIVYRHNLAKFSQNPILQEVLMETSNRILVEASPYDKIWGIGLYENDAKCIPECKWPGLNLLGKILTQVREDLKEEAKAAATTEATADNQDEERTEEVSDEQTKHANAEYTEGVYGRCSIEC